MTADLSGLHAIYLKPGELYIAEQPTIVTTVLGSCISVTMFECQRGIGAISHSLLPEGPTGQAYRYVDASIRHMLARLDTLGIQRNRLEVKMFGGSDMLPVRDGRIVPVGRRNIEVALQVIRAERLNLVASDVGGALGRKILFCTNTGEVLLKRLHSGAVQAP